MELGRRRECSSSSNDDDGIGYKIGGISVRFPYKPYGSQLAFMGRLISTLNRARTQGQGHAHALLESPTGTGKTLSLLCSALAWQHHYHSSTPPPDPLLHGGGFIPPQPDTNNPSGCGGRGVSARARRKQTRPTIYYASRTHAQITQLIREYRKTSYRVPMAILASRKHYCTNKRICSKETVDEECKLLLKDEGGGCPEFKNANKVKSHPSLQKGGCYEAHDIEDLVKVGQSVKGCSYFAAQTLAAEADLVFCPYSYVINPVIRRAMDIDIKGSILILDEAHNVEDMAREAGSFDAEEEVLYALQMELGQLCLVESVATIYQPLHEMIQGIIGWINHRQDNLEKHGFEHFCTCWTGDKALQELQEAGISPQYFPALRECATKAIKAASDAESDGVYLSGISALTLEGLFSSLCFLFADSGCNALDYQLALQRYVKRDSKNDGSGWTHLFSLWCLNPAIVFRDIANHALSIVLSSGTLSPMGSFASELGVQFEACLEAPHVIDVESQLWTTVISNGPGNRQLNASYKTADGFAFQDALGEALEEICKVVPGGVLIFFPSYKLLEKLRNRWCQTGQWARLGLHKSLFLEPRSKAEDFEITLKNYYDTISGNRRIVSGKFKRGKKRATECGNIESSPPKGAAFLAVCRGKVSEGIDFSDENARAVVIVGIPFPNKNDIQVTLKKKYNDSYKSSKGLLSGSEWYCHQAFRALNQAAGRCIRHRSDYGAIILIDERFNEERNRTYISRWIKKSIKTYDTFEASLNGLRSFFVEKGRLGQPGKGVPQTNLEVTDLNKKKLYFSHQNILNKCTTGQVVQKNNKLLNQRGRKMSSVVGKNHQETKEPVPAPISLHDTLPCHRTSEKGSGQPLRCSDTFMTMSKNSDMFVEETISVEKPTSVQCRNADPHSHTAQAFTGEVSPQTLPIINLSSAFNKDIDTLLDTTPERKVKASACIPECETRSSVNLQHKKRPKLGGAGTEICCVSSVAESSCHELNITSATSRHNECGQSAIGGGHKLHEVFSSTLVDRKLDVSCIACKSSLGLKENNYIVPCFPTSSSKLYLSHHLKHGPASVPSQESCSLIERTEVSVAVTAVASLNKSILNGWNGEGAFSNDFWSEKDGCVFRTVYCPFCTSQTYLGLRIMAGDAHNVHLLDKVFFYIDRVSIEEVEATSEPTSLDFRSNITPIESYSYRAPPQKFRSKLKLPKRDVITCSVDPYYFNV